jgi:hypothetical protein
MCKYCFYYYSYCLVILVNFSNCPVFLHSMRCCFGTVSVVCLFPYLYVLVWLVGRGEHEGCIKDGENKYMNIENFMQRDAEI